MLQRFESQQERRFMKVLRHLRVVWSAGEAKFTFRELSQVGCHQLVLVGGEPMTFNEMTTLIARWFGQAGEGGLVLPDGWFGRPYDTFWLLENVEAKNDALVITLKGDGILAFDQPTHVSVHNSQLAIGGFVGVVFRWREFGGNLVHETKYDSGEVRFIPPVGTKIT
jgi:hypothetical protein